MVLEHCTSYTSHGLGTLHKLHLPCSWIIAQVTPPMVLEHCTSYTCHGLGTLHKLHLPWSWNIAQVTPAMVLEHCTSYTSHGLGTLYKLHLPCSWIIAQATPPMVLEHCTSYTSHGLGTLHKLHLPWSWNIAQVTPAMVLEHCTSYTCHGLGTLHQLHLPWSWNIAQVTPAMVLEHCTSYTCHGLGTLHKLHLPWSWNIAQVTPPMVLEHCTSYTCHGLGTLYKLHLPWSWNIAQVTPAMGLEHCTSYTSHGLGTLHKLHLPWGWNIAQVTPAMGFLEFFSLTRQSQVKGPPDWLASPGNDGGIFHLELPAGVEAKLVRLSSLDGGSVSSLAMGAGCNSEDTGYSSDQDSFSVDQSGGKVAWKSGRSREFRNNKLLSRKSRNSSSSSGSDKASVSTSKSASLSGSLLDDSIDDDGVFLHKSNFRSSQTSSASSASTGSRCSCGLLARTDPPPEAHVARWACSRGCCKNRENPREWKTFDLEVRVNTWGAGAPAAASGGALCERLLGIVHFSKDDNRFTGPRVIVKGLLPCCDPALKLDMVADGWSVDMWSGPLTHGWSVDMWSGPLTHGWSVDMWSGPLTRGWSVDMWSGPLTGGWSVDMWSGPLTRGWSVDMWSGPLTHGWSSWLHSINGQELTWYNMDTLLSSIGKLKKVKLTLKSLRLEKSSLDLEKLVSVLTSESHDHQNVMDGMAAMYLSLDSSSSQDDSGSSHDGLVYSYPSEKNSLHHLQGMFYTLAHLVKDINPANTIKNTTLTIENRLVHVAYQQEYSDILLFAMPASHVSVHQLNVLLSDFARLLRVLFGSIESAFNKGSHSGLIDNILSYLFHQVLQMSPVSSTSPTSSVLKEKVSAASECLPFVRFSQHIPSLNLPEELMVEVDQTLSKFSSSNFANMSESFYGCRRKYHILGSCFYYSGQLVGSQLSPQDLKDIHIYLQHHGLLELTARCSIAQLVVWQEVHPTRLCHDVSDINNSFGYSEPNARWWQLIVGLKYGLFCCLLETASLPIKKLSSLCPDVFYIDQAKACLLQLQTPQLLSVLNIRVSKECQSALTKSDYCATYIKTNCEKTTQLFGESFKQKSSTSNSLVAALQSDWKKFSLRPNVPGTPGNLYQNPESGKLYPASQCSVGNAGSLELPIPTSLSTLPCRISATSPSIYQYCYLDGLEGKMIVGSDVDSPGIFQSQIVNSFYLCCRQIHDFFQDMGDKWQSHLPADDLENYEMVKSDCNLRGMKEHGVLLTFNPNNKEDGHRVNQVLEYWVVGRKLKRPSSREMFVCFHASTSQCIIDLAFKVF
ncbi:hypothetical protein Btru_053044 [Bulinus truncatus]|nr:hypothetical protein Btru_053044 [Bulinus truncatus]